MKYSPSKSSFSRKAVPFSRSAPVLAHILAQVAPHGHGRGEGAQVEAGAHPVGPPELDVVGVVVGFLEHGPYPGDPT